MQIFPDDIVYSASSVAPSEDLRAYVSLRKDGSEGYAVALYDVEAAMWLDSVRLFGRDIHAAVDYARSLIGRA